MFQGLQPWACFLRPVSTTPFSILPALSASAFSLSPLHQGWLQKGRGNEEISTHPREQEEELMLFGGIILVAL